MRGTRLSVGGLRWWMLVAVWMLCYRYSCRVSSASSPPQLNAAEERVVTHLPGFQGPLPFELRTGYVEVDERNGVRLFYYFTLSERSPADDPLMIWLSGGPGCTSFTGLVYQNGPLSFDPQGYTDGLPKLVYRPESWTKVSSIIYIDSPVGAGFSYSIADQGYNSSDTKAVDQIVIFLKKWFGVHPEFLSNPLYIAGDSYSGMIVPTVTSEIAKGIDVGSEPSLNLKGYLVGNPYTNLDIDEPSKITFAYKMGLISDQIYEAYKESCSVGDNSHRSMQCTNSLDAIHETGLYTLSRLWANNATVREALGIDKSWIRSLNFSTVDDWRPWYVDGQVAGCSDSLEELSYATINLTRNVYVMCRYTTVYSNNLTFATVKVGALDVFKFIPIPNSVLILGSVFVAV
ncbi:Serine carboxypeptidase-like 2 [Dichanthelium oligosanthes]|uniref:Serine carboxypeptidase-like 2 n=1 Tax=Dichanthelium oligosanthes TaxID=888268 RepID=A0A1E5VTF1_9POAL|nr:Serine carboxypeptidase-like 2 [Dichanthelium oligosanthes]